MQRNLISTSALWASIAQALNISDTQTEALNYLAEEEDLIFIQTSDWAYENSGTDRKRSSEATSDSFAQISQAIAVHDCGAAHDRNENAATDFYTSVGGSTNSFTDSTFATNDAVYWQDDGSYVLSSGVVDHYNDGRIEWVRPSSPNFLGSDYTLFGSDGVTMADVSQGSIGNCWWMAAAIALAEYPGRVEEVFLNRGKSDAGIYAVQFWALNVPITITVDDLLPIRDNTDGHGGNRTFYAEIGSDGSIWGSILEKAFSKFNGNYARIAGGDPVDGISTLNGSPHERLINNNEHMASYCSYYSYNCGSETEIWDLIRTYDPEQGLLVAGTPCSSGSDDTQNDYGLVNCHAYTVLGFHVLTRNGQRLVKMRNPWSIERYYGPYSDASGDLTDNDRIELGHLDTTTYDGVFFMRIEDYFLMTDSTSMNFDVETHNWQHDYHLTIDDDGSGSTPGNFYWCGSDCARYTGRITNNASVYNMIYPGIHTWRWRTYAQTNKCEQTGWQEHLISEDGSNTVYGLYDGDVWMPTIYLAPGASQTYTIELDLNMKGMSKDWSFTAWGENGPITVEVIGKTSDAWPLVERNDALLPLDEFEIGDPGPPEDAQAVALSQTAQTLQTEAIGQMADVQDWINLILNHAATILANSNTAMSAEMSAEQALVGANSVLTQAQGGDLMSLQALLVTAQGQHQSDAVAAHANAQAAYDAALALETGAYATAVASLTPAISALEQTNSECQTAFNEAQGLTATPVQTNALTLTQDACDAISALLSQTAQMQTDATTSVGNVSTQVAFALAQATEALVHTNAVDTIVSQIQQLIFLEENAGTCDVEHFQELATTLEGQATTHANELGVIDLTISAVISAADSIIQASIDAEANAEAAYIAASNNDSNLSFLQSQHALAVDYGTDASTASTDMTSFEGANTLPTDTEVVAIQDANAQNDALATAVLADLAQIIIDLQAAHDGIESSLTSFESVETQAVTIKERVNIFEDNIAMVHDNEAGTIQFATQIAQLITDYQNTVTMADNAAISFAEAAEAAQLAAEGCQGEVSAALVNLDAWKLDLDAYETSAADHAAAADIAKGLVGDVWAIVQPLAPTTDYFVFEGHTQTGQSHFDAVAAAAAAAAADHTDADALLTQFADELFGITGSITNIEDKVALALSAKESAEGYTGSAIQLAAGVRALDAYTAAGAALTAANLQKTTAQAIPTSQASNAELSAESAALCEQQAELVQSQIQDVSALAMRDFAGNQYFNVLTLDTASQLSSIETHNDNILAFTQTVIDIEIITFNAKTDAESKYVDAQAATGMFSALELLLDAMDSLVSSISTSEDDATSAYNSALSLLEGDFATEISSLSTNVDPLAANLASVNAALTEVESYSAAPVTATNVLAQIAVEVAPSAIVDGSIASAQQDVISLLAIVTTAQGHETTALGLQTASTTSVSNAFTASNNVSTYKAAVELIQIQIETLFLEAIFFGNNAAEAAALLAEGCQDDAESALLSVQSQYTALEGHLTTLQGHGTTTAGHLPAVEDHKNGAQAAHDAALTDTLNQAWLEAQLLTAEGHASDDDADNSLLLTAITATNDFYTSPFQSTITDLETSVSNALTAQNEAYAEWQTALSYTDSSIQIGFAADAETAYLAAQAAYDLALGIQNNDVPSLDSAGQLVINNIGSLSDDSTAFMGQTDSYVLDIQALIDALAPTSLTLDDWTEAQVYPEQEDPCEGYIFNEEQEDGKMRIWIGHECSRDKHVYLVLPFLTWNNLNGRLSTDDTTTMNKNRGGRNIVRIKLPTTNNKVGIEFDSVFAYTYYFRN